MIAQLRSPANGAPLEAEGWALDDGHRQFPVVDGIPFLRLDREALCAEVLAAIGAGDVDVAVALLLRDQDPFAPLPPPSMEDALELVREQRRCSISFSDALDRLRFGPVANYFRVRSSTPTFLSGLGLIAHYGRPAGTFVEIACGTGQLLREVARRGVPGIGIDLVFSKLWLARHFVLGDADAQLVCADVCQPLPLMPARETRTVLCHDAFYFLPDKAQTLLQMREVAGESGRVLVGHTHNAHVDSGIAGTPLTPEGYAALAPEAVFFDDAELTREALGNGKAPGRSPTELRGAEAVAFAVGKPGPCWDELLLPPPGTALHLNPLLVAHGPTLTPRWPSERMASEYRDAGYLTVEGPVPAQVLAAAAAGEVGRGTSPEVDALARRRVLVELHADELIAAGKRG